MIFKVMSKKVAEAESANFNIPTAIISICDPGDRANFAINENIVDILRLNFADVGKEEANAMTADDAERIKLFVDGVWELASQIIVHCEGGVSRSAGTCAGILKAIYNDDMQIFDDARYCPNMHCYRLVVEEYIGRYNEQEAMEKFEHQLDLWKEKFWSEDE